MIYGMNSDQVTAKIGKENFTLLELAVKCSFLTFAQEREVLYLFFQRIQDDPNSSMVDLLREQKFLSDDQIDFLTAVRNHIRVTQKDRKFGTIAVANRFTDSGKVEKALNQQAEIFRKTKNSRKIGDIMVENRDISEKDKTAVLLHQDRIEDRYLHEAFETIADSRLEALKMEKRFGAIAARMGYASAKDIDRALKIQKKAEKEGKPKVYIGEILKEMLGLTSEDINTILRKQKVYVKQILNLEQAMQGYSSVVKLNRKFNDLFECSIVNNGLEAFLRMKKGYSGPIDPGGLYNWLNLYGIRYGLASETDLKEFLDKGVPGSSMRAARGEEPLSGKDGKAEFYFDTGFTPKQDAAEPAGDMHFVKKGGLIARITPPEPGIPGKDVLGNTILPPEPKRYVIHAGEGVSSDDGLNFYARADGVPVLYKGRILMISRDHLAGSRKVIEGNFTSGTRLDHDRYDLEIKGNINDQAIVKCNTVLVRNDVKGHIQALGDIEVKGSVGKSLQEDPLLKRVSKIDAAGSVAVSKWIENADITSGRTVNAANSDVVSCSITAYGGIYLKNVMSNGGRPSRLVIRDPLNDRLIRIRRTLDDHREKLGRLNFEKEMEEINRKIQTRLELMEEYRKKIGFLDLMAESADRDFLPDFSKADESTASYLSDLVETFAGKTGQQIFEILEKERELNEGLHKRAVKDHQRLEKEYRVKERFIQKKIEESADTIEDINAAMRKLMAEQEMILMKKESRWYNPEPEIKVKNQISKGTVINGRNSAAVIENTMYGVKLTEEKNTDTGGWEIRISGYYDR